MSTPNSVVNYRKPPFDRELGETIPALGANYVIVPTMKWRDTPIWYEACARAEKAFRKAGVSVPTFSDDTTLVQEYHGDDRIVLVFAHFGRKAFQKAPNWLYVPIVVKLTPPLKAHLVLTGRWKTATRH